MRVRLHAFANASRANGPGLRAVVWFQGCTLRCPGCFNPATHDPAAGYEADTAELARQLLGSPNGIEGVSVSGGEPFQQPQALLDLLQRLAGSPLGKLLFSGYTLPQLQAQPLGPAILYHLDALIAGPYLQSQHLGHGLLGSANQRLHLLSARYRPEDFQSIAISEVILHPDGSVTISGIRPPHL